MCTRASFQYAAIVGHHKYTQHYSLVAVLIKISSLPFDRLRCEHEASLDLEAIGTVDRLIWTLQLSGLPNVDLGRSTFERRHDIDHRPGPQDNDFVRIERSDHKIRISVYIHVHPSGQRVSKSAEGPIQSELQIRCVNPLRILGDKTTG